MPKRIITAVNNAHNLQLGISASEYVASPWFRTVLDPAHARDYGCRGIPDENQMPTLLLNGRVTHTLNGGGKGIINYLKCVDGVFTQATSLTMTSCHDITLIQTGLTLNPVLMILHGDVNGGGEGWGFRFLSTDIDPLDLDNPSRLVALSMTTDYIGKEINRGGFWDAGYLPVVSSALVTSSEPTEYRIDTSNLPNYVTYTGSSTTGTYIISKFNNYETYRAWKNRDYIDFAARVSNWSGELGTFRIKINDTIAPRYALGMTPAFVRYTPPVPTEFADILIRCTLAEVVETVSAYNRGGTDGELYDPATVEDLKHLYDDYNLIFPASYNDTGKVATWVLRNLKKLPTFAASVSRHLPKVGKLATAVATILGEEGTDTTGATPAVQPPQPTQPAPSKKTGKRKNKKGKSKKAK